MSKISEESRKAITQRIQELRKDYLVIDFPEFKIDSLDKPDVDETSSTVTRIYEKISKDKGLLNQFNRVKDRFSKYFPPDEPLDLDLEVIVQVRVKLKNQDSQFTTRVIWFSRKTNEIIAEQS
jgi:hypothetical protein